MVAVARGLVFRLWAAQAAVTAAVAAIATVAALVEGGAPAPRALLALSLPAGALLGAAWTLARWRAHGPDIALAAAGVPPAAPVALLAALSLPPLLAAPDARRPAPPPAWTLETGADRIRVVHPGGALVVAWRDGEARRTDTGDRFPGLPPPAPAPRAPSPRSPWLPPAARALVLLALVAWLGLRRTPPGPAPTLAAGLGAVTLAYLAGALA